MKAETDGKGRSPASPIFRFLFVTDEQESAHVGGTAQAQDF